MRVYKYKLELIVPACIAKVEMPIKRKPISVGEQDGEMVVWAEVDENDEYSMDAVFVIIPTGFSEVPDGDLEFLGTLQMPQQGAAWHIYWHKDFE